MILRNKTKEEKIKEEKTKENLEAVAGLLILGGVFAIGYFLGKK